MLSVEIDELIKVLEGKITEVEGKKMVDLKVLIDLLTARKVKVATFPDGPPDGG